MITKIKSLTLIFMAVLIIISSCKKEEYTFGELKSPAGLTLTTAITGVDASNPNGSGVGTVNITATATNALTYNIDFGDGTSAVVPSGSIVHKYANPGTSDYTITVNAVGTGGIITSTSKKITVFVLFNIPPGIVAALTNGASRVWVTDKETYGHFGVGPADAFFPNWYEAPANTREACAYDDEITFTKDPVGKIFMNVDNKGTSMSIGAATASYGVAGGDGCYGFSTGGNKQLVFMDATSTSTPANSTRIQFTVPGNGIINFGTGGKTYEIISYTPTTIFLRNIGADGNSWYQRLKVKP